MSKSEPEPRHESSVEQTISAFSRGEPVLIHDAADREGETDLVYPATAVTPEAVARLRNDAGGLVCVALSNELCEQFELPFASEAIDHPLSRDPDVGYDDRSSFSLTVNHRDTYTGITDADRSLTIKRLGALSANPDEVDFLAEFHAPGHVHLLRGAPDLLADREGHTELGLALAKQTAQPQAVVVCEMLDDETGTALTPARAQAYARNNGLAYIEGRSLVDRFA